MNVRRLILIFASVLLSAGCVRHGAYYQGGHSGYYGTPAYGVQGGVVVEPSYPVYPGGGYYLHEYGGRTYLPLTDRHDHYRPPLRYDRPKITKPLEFGRPYRRFEQHDHRPPPPPPPRHDHQWNRRDSHDNRRDRDQARDHRHNEDRRQIPRFTTSRPDHAPRQNNGNPFNRNEHYDRRPHGK